MSFHSIIPTHFKAYDSVSGHSTLRLAIKSVSHTFISLLFFATFGCGSMFAVVAHGPFCPYRGVTADLSVITDWSMIKSSYGWNIPLGTIDIPFSFVADTFTLVHLNEMDLDQRPRHFTS